MIRVERDGPLAVVTLARPEQRNALTPEMLEALASAVADQGGACGCVLLRGEGKMFCAGFDLAACRGAPDGAAMRRLLVGLHGAVRAIRSCPAPVVVACQGGAIAGGCAIVAGADFALADRGARLGYPVVLLGISPAVSAPTLIPRIGPGGARSRMLDPGLVNGEQALRLGLVSDLLDAPEQVDGAARRLAAELASKPRDAIRATKAWVNGLDRTASLDEDALGVSLSLTGGSEERSLLEAYWEGRRSTPTPGPSPE